jgi:hypothetical protein
LDGLDIFSWWGGGVILLPIGGGEALLWRWQKNVAVVFCNALTRDIAPFSRCSFTRYGTPFVYSIVKGEDSATTLSMRSDTISLYMIHQLLFFVLESLPILDPFYFRPLLRFP